MAVVVKAPAVAEGRRQRVLAGMAEWGMAKVVGEAQCFGQIFIKTERTGHRAADLRHFDRMGEADPKVIAVGRDEHLRLVAEAAERDGVDDAVAVALENIARSPGTAIGFRKGPAARLAWLRG